MLLDAGLIQRDGLVQSVLCENCDMPHEAQIVFEDGTYGHFCPDLGFVPVERADLVAVRPNLAALVEQLHVAFECAPGGISQLGPQTWRVGLVDTPGGRAVVYFHTCLQNDDHLVSLENALRAEIRRDYALVVTAAGHLPYREAATCHIPQMVQLDFTRAHWKTTEPVRRIVNTAFEVAGLPVYGPHAFRHMLARHAAKNSKTVAEFIAKAQNLGHSNPLTTLRSYGQISRDDQRRLITGESE